MHEKKKRRWSLRADSGFGSRGTDLSYICRDIWQQELAPPPDGDILVVFALEQIPRPSSHILTGLGIVLEVQDDPTRRAGR